MIFFECKLHLSNFLSETFVRNEVVKNILEMI